MAKSNQTRANTSSGAPAMAAAVMALNPALTKAWLEMMSDSARFLAERLQKDLETQKAMLACKTPAELLQIQAEFFKTAMEQYSEHAMRLKETMTTVTEETVKGVRSGHSRGYDDVPL
ncbi:phasin family protein [Seohaeicola saemankumensis]|uniref:Phasin family protein n=1 Tax=Seohaeicola saemankumensis TaxID=481181 RepID=A0ABW3TB09_9RHOB